MKKGLLSFAFVLTCMVSQAQIGKWLLNNNATDATGNNPPGTLMGSPTFTTTAPPEGSHALVVNGTSQYVDLSAATNFPTAKQDRTISAWAMTNSISGSRSIFAYGSPNTTQAMVIGLSNSSLIGGGFANNMTVANFWTIGVWHHICLTYNGTTGVANLYADGALVSTSSRNWTLVFSKAFIGRGVNSADYWSGSIDDVRIYNYALSASEVQTIATLPPAPPTSLAASAASATTINLSWTDASSNETGFAIERSTTSGSGFTQIATPGANATSYTDATLPSPGTTYYYRIRSAINTVYSTYSAEANATTFAVPATPTSLSATGTTPTSIGLTWTDASNNETGFQIERSTSSGTGFSVITTAAANATTYTDNSVTSGTTYFYRIRAMNGSSTFSSYSSEASSMPLVVPSAPSNLAGNATASAIVLTWTDGSNNEDGFEVERSLTTVTGFSHLANVVSNTTTYSDVTATSGATYYYRVRAYKSSYYSAYTAEASASLSTMPVAPNSLTSTAASSTSVSITWVDASSNETGFLIERSTSPGANFTQVASTGANASTFTDTGLLPATIYYYRVRATNASGNSDYTEEISVLTLPNPPSSPSGLTGTATADRSVSLQWTDASNNESGFEIERSSTSGIGFAKVGAALSNAVTFIDQDLIASTSYYYRVRAVNTGGNSAYSNEIMVKTLMTPPSNFKTEVSSSSAIKVLWSDNSSDETGFQIERSTVPGSGFTLLATTAANATQFINSLLIAGKTYYYRIRAINASNVSPYSEEISGTTIMSLPAAPGSLTVVSVNSGYVNLSWYDASINETGFQIERSLSPTTDFQLVGTSEMNSISYSDQSVVPGTTYYYRVRSLNPGGFSSYTPAVKAVLSLTGSTELCSNIFCTADGVGIGTNIVPSGYKMAVKGKVIMEGAKVNVQSKWPDYVFEDNYDMIEIPELKKYIEENGHLPNVPAAQTVAEEGIDVEQINVLLLEKIEEMSLYLIRMEERVRKLEQENADLKKKH